MRKILSGEISTALESIIKKSLVSVEKRTVELLKTAKASESEKLSVWAIDSLIENADIAEKTCSHACQDCGLALVFVEVGSDVHIIGNLNDAINEGVKNGYAEARKSVCDPLTRINTTTNTPAIIYHEITDGDKIKISFLAKGAGSENMSKTYMLTPSKGREGIIAAAVDCVKTAGANPCPPVLLGIGIGGTMDKAAVLSKKALLRESSTPSTNKDIANLESEILSAVNDLKIGAQGLGGNTTALAVHIESTATHIGMLPVAITIQCHSVRHGSVIL